jgi:hypothetical protein
MPKVHLSHELSGAGEAIHRMRTIEADAETRLQRPLPEGRQTIELPLSSGDDLKFAWLSCDIDADIFVRAGSEAWHGPIRLRNHTPFIWSDGCGFANPFPRGVTVLKIEQHDDKAGLLLAHFLYDTTKSDQKPAAHEDEKAAAAGGKPNATPADKPKSPAAAS